MKLFYFLLTGIILILLLNKCYNLFAMELILKVNVNYFSTCMKMYVVIRDDLITFELLFFKTKIIHVYVEEYLFIENL
jgi:hypothetical protein